jgi:amino acid transporter
VFNKINIWLIVLDHVKTMRNFKTHRISVEDILLFLVAPICGGLFLVFGLQFRLDLDAANVLITSLSLFSALLFNLLLLIFDILRKESGDEEQPVIRRQFLSQIYSNVSFGILNAVICIALLLLLFINIDLPLFVDAVNLIVDILVINFILTMLMVLKRVHILLRKEAPP